MIQSRKIKKVVAQEILDSRGNPTLKVTVYLKNGVSGSASVPSGASTGSHEALELRDGGKRYGGKGVQKAVKNVNEKINKLIRNLDVVRQQDIDRLMIKLDGTENKSKLGANAILGVSLACAHAGARTLGMPLYRYIRKIYDIHYRDYFLPFPSMNILNGGRHADFATDVQEFMIIPKHKQFSKRVQMGSEIFHALGEILKKKGLSTNKGDEGGYAVHLKKNEDAFKLIMEAVKKAGYKKGKEVTLGIDAAASEFYTKSSKKYYFDKRKVSATTMIKIYKEWVKKYPLESLEDGLHEDDWVHWQKMTKDVSETLHVGDDLFVTNSERLQKGIDMGVAHAILIKLNQIGTLTETIKTIQLAKTNGYKVIISHRSGETCDTTIADLSVAVNASYIKTGSLSRSERVSKYNRLMEIESELTA